jgi:hypothetical protein
MRSPIALAAFTLTFFFSLSVGHAVYLNDDAGVTVAVGPGSSGGFVNVPEAQSLANIIDLDAASDPDFHSQTSHVWWSGGPLELVFNLQTAYDLTTLHFWNYFGEAFDVDSLFLRFLDPSGAVLGNQDVLPALGGPGTPNEMILAEDIVLTAPPGVQFVVAFLTATNNQLDFNNMGFTGDLSSSEPGPGPGPAPVPAPAALGLLGVGVLLSVVRAGWRSAPTAR